MYYNLLDINNRIKDNNGKSLKKFKNKDGEEGWAIWRSSIDNNYSNYGKLGFYNPTRLFLKNQGILGCNVGSVETDCARYIDTNSFNKNSGNYSNGFWHFENDIYKDWDGKYKEKATKNLGIIATFSVSAYDGQGGISFLYGNSSDDVLYSISLAAYSSTRLDLNVTLSDGKTSLEYTDTEVTLDKQNKGNTYFFYCAPTPDNKTFVALGKFDRWDIIISKYVYTINDTPYYSDSKQLYMVWDGGNDTNFYSKFGIINYNES